MNRTIKFLAIIIILVSAIILGINLYTKHNNNSILKELAQNEQEEILDDCTDEYGQYENELISTNSNEEKISPNCKITFRILYSKCNDEINEYVKVPDNLVNC